MEVKTNNPLRDRAERYMKENRLSKAALANQIDVHRTSVSQYFNSAMEELTQGTIEKIENGIQALMNKNVDVEVAQDTPVPRKKTGVLHETTDSIGVIAVCQSCQDYMGLGVIVGRSGFGKTYTLKYYAKTAKVAYVECNESMNARDLIKAIEKVLSLPHMTGSIDDRLDNIKDFFNTNAGYLLIIDEADKLITKYTQKKAEILRNIYDQSDVGLILSGEPALEKMVKQYIPRMANRIDFAFELEGLTKNDVMRYIDGYEFDEDAANELVRRATNDKNGCFRLFDRTFKNVMRVADGQAVTLETVKKASSMMLI